MLNDGTRIYHVGFHDGATVYVKPASGPLTSPIFEFELGEEERQKTWFPNKKDRIVQHLKKCPNFFAKTNEEEREKVFAILQPNANSNTNSDIPSLTPQKRPCKYFKI